ncbi:MAG TPA: hypothetical protein VNE39_19190 [Planctomycetota bacterium]|nr:hypothetical protein [Planctomycetota bacterium]
MRLLAAAMGVVAVCLLALGGVAAYRAIARFRNPLPPETMPARKVAPPPRKRVVTPVPKAAEEPITCPIIPEPKVYTEKGRTAELLGPARAAIVLGARATEPERYAGERLQGLLERRFGRQLPIRVEDSVEDGVRQILLLGQRGTNEWLDRLCREREIDLGEASPGHDGFVLEALDDGERQVVLIGGSNDRGVIYGQDAFFDLLRSEDGKVVFPIVSVRDWPSIAWRGRPHPDLRQHGRPGVFDVYVRARFNFIDLRNAPVYMGAFGFAPGEALNKQEVGDIVAQAHRRGIFVYGTVSCSHGDQDPSGVEKTFMELRDLGVDGFWIDFNDRGAPEGAPELVARVVRLGQRVGIIGRAVATTPPIGAYQRPATDYARKMAKVPGFDEAMWIFTCPPTQAMAEAARGVGLKCPGWWHNWPSGGEGLLFGEYGGKSLRAGGQPAYMDIQPLSTGWHNPSYEVLRGAAQWTDTVMFWRYFVEEYAAGVLGIWAWRPERHDWGRTRQTVYTHVFGPSAAAAAQEFDDRLARLKTLFVLARPGPRPGYNWPPRLAKAEDRPEALRLVDELDARLKQLEATAPSETTTEPTRLGELFLEPMRATVTYARSMAEWESPAPAMAQLEERLLEELAYGDVATAEQQLLQAREKLLPQIEQTEAALGELWGVKDWLAGLRERLERFSYWPAFAAERQKAIEGRISGFLRERDVAKDLAGVPAPPEGRVLAELRPADWLRRPALARGLWAAGLAKANGLEAVAVAHPAPAGWVPVERGEYAEVRAELPVPQFAGRLGLLLLLATPAGGGRPARVVAELWGNGRRLLAHEVGVAGPAAEWLNVDVTEVAKGAERLALRFRVVNERHASRFESLVYLGPVRLQADAPGR